MKDRNLITENDRAAAAVLVWVNINKCYAKPLNFASKINKTLCKLISFMYIMQMLPKSITMNQRDFLYAYRSKRGGSASTLLFGVCGLGNLNHPFFSI